MICPLRFGKQLHEGGEECQHGCAWLLESNYGHGYGDRLECNGFGVCAIAKLAVSTEDENGLFIANKA